MSSPLRAIPPIAPNIQDHMITVPVTSKTGISTAIVIEIPKQVLFTLAVHHYTGSMPAYWPVAETDGNYTYLEYRGGDCWFVQPSRVRSSHFTSEVWDAEDLVPMTLHQTRRILFEIAVEGFYGTAAPRRRRAS
ncbi:hypothetical protein [Thioalkalivibrio sp. ALE19]|uniref:hypothetical protein n=1 Tax=Thioalkalivibrio sp. ALE19 TaxID=1266909 RepID=UPI00048BC61C|nr:hypothetical protein [Thioalkalivibrio sp. ALE19]